jgi:hypothetical protein
MPKYYRRKVDANQAEVVLALRTLGVEVLDLTAVGGGCPDILCLFGNSLFFVEIKKPFGPKGGDESKWTPAQKKFRLRWERAPMFVLRTTQDAVDLVNCLPSPSGRLNRG